MSAAPDGRPVAILGAMAEEIAALLDDLDRRTDYTVSGFQLHSGNLEGVPVLLARCGIGKVNAAAVAQVLVLQGARCLIFTGVAGAVDPALAVGDIVIANEAGQHDVDVTPLGYERGLIPGESTFWAADPSLVDLALTLAARQDDATVVAGRVVSGDQFIADPQRTRELRTQFDASCVEMEGGAVAQVCCRAGLPFVIIRSISDSADHDAQVSFREFTKLAAGRAKRLVSALVRELPNLALQPPDVEAAGDRI